jgi:hypothetical protein
MPTFEQRGDSECCGRLHAEVNDISYSEYFTKMAYIPYILEIVWRKKGGRQNTA